MKMRFLLECLIDKKARLEFMSIHRFRPDLLVTSVIPYRMRMFEAVPATNIRVNAFILSAMRYFQSDSRGGVQKLADHVKNSKD